MHPFRPIAFILLLLLAMDSYAQQYGFTRFSVDEGLPRSGVYCMAEDDRGHLWAGTEGGGLARFDGIRFEVFNLSNGLPGNTVRALLNDRDGNVWAGMDGQGLVYFDGRKFHKVDTTDGLSGNYVRSMAQDTTGAIWVGTMGAGISRVRLLPSEGVIVEAIAHPLLDAAANIHCALADSKGRIWFGTDNGLLRVTGNSWEQFTTANGLPDIRVSELFEDDLGKVWLGTEGGVGYFDRDSCMRPVGDERVNAPIRAIAQDGRGHMWFGTQDGALRYDGTSFRFFVEANGLSNARIRDLLLDRSGNVWLATQYGGLCRFSGEQFTHFSRRHGLAGNQVLAVRQMADGAMRLGTASGLSELRPNGTDGQWAIERNAVSPLFGDGVVHTIVIAPTGEVWHGTDKGILIASGTNVRPFAPDGKPFGEVVKAMLFDADGSVWVGSTSGVTHFLLTEKGHVFNRYHTNETLTQSEVSAFCRDASGRVWAGFLHDAVVIFDGDQTLYPKFPKDLNSVTSLVVDASGKVWLGSEGHGLFVCNRRDGTPGATDFRHFGTQDGLVSVDIHQLAFDAKGQLWTGTATGVSRLSFDSAGNINSVRHYGTEDGFTGTETTDNGICLDRDGNIWFGTVRGVTRFALKAVTTAIAPPSTFIDHVSLGFGAMDWDSTTFAQGTDRFGLPIGLELPFASNSITFHVKGIDLTALDRVRYQWKLDGFQEEWSPVTSLTQATFTNLAPGTYTFMLRARNDDGVWTQQPVEYVFTVLPPFYRTWGFIVFAVVVGAGILFLVVKVRERKLLRDRKQLQQLVDVRTHELRDERDRSNELLLNILPKETAEELKTHGKASVRHYDMVSVLFTDFVGFTTITENISHDQLVTSLDQYFRVFDDVMSKYHIEKIKTIGDAYMAAGGIPVSNTDNPIKVVMAALDILVHVEQLNQEKRLKGEAVWQLRAGIHTGSVIAGVVGKNKFAYDIWGDAVNTAARMESSGEVGRVNISGSTYALVSAYFLCTHRGKIAAKNKGHIDMYFVEGLRPEYCEAQSTTRPNAAMMHAMGLEEMVTA